MRGRVEESHTKGEHQRKWGARDEALSGDGAKVREATGHLPSSDCGVKGRQSACSCLPQVCALLLIIVGKCVHFLALFLPGYVIITLMRAAVLLGVLTMF